MASLPFLDRVARAKEAKGAIPKSSSHRLSLFQPGLSLWGQAMTSRRLPEEYCSADRAMCCCHSRLARFTPRTQPRVRSVFQDLPSFRIMCPVPSAGLVSRTLGANNNNGVPCKWRHALERTSISSVSPFNVSAHSMEHLYVQYQAKLRLPTCDAFRPIHSRN